jgi:hypothetical protein
MDCFPDQKEGLLHFLAVLRLTMTLDGLRVRRSIMKELESMFARVAHSINASRNRVFWAGDACGERGISDRSNVRRL